MPRLITSILGFWILAVFFAFADSIGGGGVAPGSFVNISGTPTTNNCAKWVNSTTLGDAGAACGTGGSGATIQGTPAANQLTDWFDSTHVQGITTGTGVVTALGVNTDTSGGFMTLTGAPGTGVKTMLGTAVNTNGGALTMTGVPGTGVQTALTTAVDTNGGIFTSTGAAGTGVKTALGVATDASGGMALVNGTPTVGDCLKWSATGVQDAGQSCPPKSVFDVVSYGADPTGVADSTTFITNAYNAASTAATNHNGNPTNSIIYFECGTYKISSGMTIAAAVIFEGADQKCVTLSFTGTGALFTLNQGAQQGPVFQNIALHGTYAGDGSPCNNSTSNQIGMIIGGATGFNKGQIAANTEITFFCAGVVVGNNAYIFSFLNTTIGQNYENIIFPQINVTANGSWTTSNNTITMRSALPYWIPPAAKVYSRTNGVCLVGTYSSGAGTTTLTLTGNAACASSGTTDTVQIQPNNSGEEMTFDKGFIGWAASGLDNTANNITLTASSITAGSTTTVTANAALPSWVKFGCSIYDVTAAKWIGFVQEAFGTTITFQKASYSTGSGATDTLRIVPPSVYIGSQEMRFKNLSMDNGITEIGTFAGAIVGFDAIHMEWPGFNVENPIISVLDAGSIVGVSDGYILEAGGALTGVPTIYNFGHVNFNTMSAYSTNNSKPCLICNQAGGYANIYGTQYDYGYLNLCTGGLCNNEGGGRNRFVGPNTYTASTALTNIVGLATTLLPGRNYEFDMELYFSACAAAGGVQVDFNNSAGLTSVVGTIEIPSAAAYASGAFAAVSTAVGATAACTGLHARGIAVCPGPPSNYVSCTLGPRAAQNAASGTTTITDGMLAVKPLN